MSATRTGLEGKVAVVTGAGRMRSIGRQVALVLAGAGCDVVVTGTGRPPERYPDDERAAGWRDIESVAEEIRRGGRKALPVVADVSDLAAVEALAERVVSDLGRVDIVVNNAAAARAEDRKPVVDLDPELWEKVLAVNLTGTFYMCKVFGQKMIEAGRGGSIVNLSSIAAKRLDPNNAAYAASKAAVQALTGCMAREVGRHGIRVNAVCPGLIDTYRMDDLGRGEGWEAAVRAIPIPRAGTGEDIAHTIAFLCSDEASWITAQVWNVDGGMVVH